MRKLVTLVSLAVACGVGLGLVATSARVERVSGAAPANLASASFVIDAADGYGVTQCLSGGEACGQVVADAFCETKGFTKAQTFRGSDEPETTASIAPVSATSADAPQAEGRAILITCRR